MLVGSMKKTNWFDYNINSIYAHECLSAANCRQGIHILVLDKQRNIFKQSNVYFIQLNEAKM